MYGGNTMLGSTSQRIDPSRPSIAANPPPIPLTRQSITPSTFTSSSHLTANAGKLTSFCQNLSPVCPSIAITLTMHSLKSSTITTSITPSLFMSNSSIVDSDTAGKKSLSQFTPRASNVGDTPTSSLTPLLAADVNGWCNLGWVVTESVDSSNTVDVDSDKGVCCVVVSAFVEISEDILLLQLCRIWSYSTDVNVAVVGECEPSIPVCSIGGVAWDFPTNCRVVLFRLASIGRVVASLFDVVISLCELAAGDNVTGGCTPVSVVSISAEWEGFVSTKREDSVVPEKGVSVSFERRCFVTSGG